MPQVIIIKFEFSFPTDLYNDENKLNSIETLNLISFIRLKNNIELIKNLIVDNLLYMI